MTFHIGQQTAGVVNMVAGDQRIEGGQQGSAVTDRDARRAAEQLRSALAAVAPSETVAPQARAHAAEIGAALHAPQPDRSRIAALLERLTRLLSAAGSLATAGAAVTGPLHTLAGWLGVLGQPVLHLLPG